MMHRELDDQLAVNRIDHGCSPMVETFLFASGYHSGSTASATADSGQVTFAGWTAGAFHNGELRGLISISDTTSDKTAMVFILVGVEWRRRGIALALIKAAKSWAIEQGMQNLLVTCSRSDWPTRSLLEKIGARLDLIFGEIVARVPIGDAIERQRDDGRAIAAARKSGVGATVRAAES